MAFEPLPAVPDHSALEQEILGWWEQRGHLRQAARAEPRRRALQLHRRADHGEQPDGRPPRLGPHAEGRLPALQGAARASTSATRTGSTARGSGSRSRSRRRSGLNSKRDIEEYGLAEFAERCKERVAQYSEVITDQDRRLGRWMDWDNDYYTFSDTNIEYIWRFLKAVHERGWLYKGHRSTQWCPRCGTSLSQHEQAGEENYEELEHPSLYVRFPLQGARRRGADGLDDDAVDAAGERRRRRQAGRGVRPARTAAGSLASVPGRELRARGQRRGARRPRVPGAVRRPAGPGGSRPPRSSRGTRSRSTRAPASSTSRRAAAPRTSSSRACTACP